MQLSREQLMLAGYGEDSILSCPAGEPCLCDLRIWQQSKYVPATICGLSSKFQEPTSDAHSSRE